MTSWECQLPSHSARRRTRRCQSWRLLAKENSWPFRTGRTHCTEGQLNYDAQRICPQNWVSVSTVSHRTPVMYVSCTMLQCCQLATLESRVSYSRIATVSFVDCWIWLGHLLHSFFRISLLCCRFGRTVDSIVSSAVITQAICGWLGSLLPLERSCCYIYNK